MEGIWAAGRGRRDRQCRGWFRRRMGTAEASLGSLQPEARGGCSLKPAPKMLVSLAAPQPVSGGGGGPRAPRAETGNS